MKRIVNAQHTYPHKSIQHICKQMEIQIHICKTRSKLYYTRMCKRVRLFDVCLGEKRTKKSFCEFFVAIFTYSVRGGHTTKSITSTVNGINICFSFEHLKTDLTRIFIVKKVFTHQYFLVLFSFLIAFSLHKQKCVYCEISYFS